MPQYSSRNGFRGYAAKAPDAVHRLGRKELFRLAVIPTILSFICFIFVILCLFAGSKKNLGGLNMVTLDTSKLGQVSAAPSAAPTASNPISNALHTVTGAAEHAANDGISAVIDALDIPPFYSMFMLSYCEGEVTNGSLYQRTDFTYCSDADGKFHFDPGTIMEEKIPGVSHLPDWVTEPLNDIFDGINKLTLASNVMVGFYIMSVVLTAFAFIGGCLTFFVRDNLAYFVNCVWCGVTAFSLFVGSIITTVVIKKIVDVVKEYGGKVNVSAYEGKAFIALSWVATILMLIAMGCWIPGARAFWRYQMKDAKRKTGQAMKNPMQGNDFFSQSSSPMRGPMQGGPTPDWPMQDGPMPDGPMRGGPMPDGPMRGGPMRGGPMRGGPMQGEDGEVGEDGPMRGGPMRGGRMRGEDGEDGEDRVDMVDMRR